MVRLCIGGQLHTQFWARKIEELFTDFQITFTEQSCIILPCRVTRFWHHVRKNSPCGYDDSEQLKFKDFQDPLTSITTQFGFQKLSRAYKMVKFFHFKERVATLYIEHITIMNTLQQPKIQPLSYFFHNSNIFKSGMKYIAITGCTVAQHCCKGDQRFQWQKPRFDPPYILNPLIFSHKILHR